MAKKRCPFCLISEADTRLQGPRRRDYWGRCCWACWETHRNTAQALSWGPVYDELLDLLEEQGLLGVRGTKVLGST